MDNNNLIENQTLETEVITDVPSKTSFQISLVIGMVIFLFILIGTFVYLMIYKGLDTEPKAEQASTPEFSKVISLELLSPKENDAFLNNTTTTIKYRLQNLPEDSTDTKFEVGISLIEKKSNQALFSFKVPVETNNNGIQEYQFMTPRPHYGKASSSDLYKLQMVVAKSQKRKPNKEELAELKTKYSPEELTIYLTHPEITVAASSTSPEFTILETNSSMILQSKYYDDTGYATIGEHELFDVWGGRFELQLDELTDKQAIFTKFFDRKPVGKITLELHQEIPIEIGGRELAMEPNGKTSDGRPVAREGTIRYINKSYNTGTFIISTKEKIFSQNYKIPYTEPVKQSDVTKRASLQLTSQAPFSLVANGTYNNTKLCESNLKYILDYGDGTSETMMTDSSCEIKNFTKQHTYPNKERTYRVALELYTVAQNEWTHFVQTSGIVRVKANGTMTFDPIVRY